MFAFQISNNEFHLANCCKHKVCHLYISLSRNQSGFLIKIELQYVFKNVSCSRSNEI
uniref:GH05088p n=1 Tax=Drosophila melanogaster TaxID=7227 RepID=Q8SXQ2_DROME|nr:GH05088p [Drosophila melanogaster]